MNSTIRVPVSVIVPCYRCTATIGRALDSILAQSAAPAEVLLIDDGSGDGTLAALQAHQARHGDTTRVVSLPVNCGAAAARNAGWDAAIQPFIAFLDADDSWHPEKLALQHAYMQRNPEVALCGHGRVWVQGDITADRMPPGPAAIRIGARGLLFRNAFSTPTVMAKRALPFRFDPDRRHAEDVFLWQQIAFSGLRIDRLELDLAYIHKAPYGATGLSADLWQMERAELDNFVAHYKAKRIGLGLLAAAAAFSYGKHLKRVLVATG